MTLESIKLILEIITTFSTVCVIISHFFEVNLKKRLFSKTIPLFFKGIITSENRRIRGFKALKANKENLERTQNIIKAITNDYTEEDLFVLNKEQLFTFLQDSKVLTKIQVRK